MTTTDPDLAMQLTEGFPCVLCDAEDTAVVGAFEPTYPWDFSRTMPAANKKRLILYRLCERCFGRREYNVDDLEERLKERMRLYEGG